ncbi:MAG: flagellar biosynthesis protein FliR [Clostridia bacterium]|nr:flagellar biosynthesis protein FliR [Clostridia bacterium]
MPEFESLQLGFLVLARITAFMSAAPFFSMKGMPGLVRVGMGFFLAVLIYPAVHGMEDIPTEIVAYVFLVGKEVLVGLVLGFVSMLTFTAVRIAGEFMDIQMGFAMAAVFDPQNQSRITLVGQFMNILGILLFLAIDGHHILLMALSHSYELIPLQGAVFKTAFVAAIVKSFVGMFALGFRVAAPFIAVLVICDISLGLLARTVPQLNVFILGFPMKAGLGIITLTLALPVLAVVIGNILSQMEKDLVLIMEYLAP